MYLLPREQIRILFIDLVQMAAAEVTCYVMMPICKITTLINMTISNYRARMKVYFMTVYLDRCMDKPEPFFYKCVLTLAAVYQLSYVSWHWPQKNSYFVCKCFPFTNVFINNYCSQCLHKQLLETKRRLEMRLKGHKGACNRRMIREIIWEQQVLTCMCT